MKRELYLAALSCLFALPLATLSVADTLQIPIGQQGGVYTEKPSLGMTMDMVKSTFGSARETFPAIGQPPITRWEYDSFTVYFEFQTVIHSVSKHTPKVAE